jgi:hypothetical protein
MLEFVDIEVSMQDRGYPRQEKASGSEQDTIEGIVSPAFCESTPGNAGKHARRF